MLDALTRSHGLINNERPSARNWPSGAGGRIFRNLDFPSGSATIQHFRPVPVRNSGPVTAPSLKADDPDTPAAHIVEQGRKARRVFIKKTQIQNDRFSGEESTRSGNLIVQTVEPEGEGRLRGQDKREKRAATGADAHGDV